MFFYITLLSALLASMQVSFIQKTAHDYHDELKLKNLLSPEAETVYQHILTAEDSMKALKLDRIQVRARLAKLKTLREEEEMRGEDVMERARSIISYAENPLVVLPGFVELASHFISEELKSLSENFRYFDALKIVCEHDLASLSKRLEIHDHAFLNLSSIFTDYYDGCLREKKLVKIDDVDRFGFKLGNAITLPLPNRNRNWESATLHYPTDKTMTITVLEKKSSRVVNSKSLRGERILNVKYSNTDIPVSFTPFMQFAHSKRYGGTLSMTFVKHSDGMSRKQTRSVIAKQVNMQFEIARDYEFTSIVIEASELPADDLIRMDYMKMYQRFAKIYAYLPIKLIYLTK